MRHSNDIQITLTTDYKLVLNLVNLFPNREGQTVKGRAYFSILGRDSQNFAYFLSWEKKIKKVQSKKKILKNLLFTKNLKIFLIFALKMVLSTKLSHFLNVFHKFLQSMPDLIKFLTKWIILI